MALPSNSLLRRKGILKPLIRDAVQEALEATMAEALGEARLGYRSGYYTRSLITPGEGAAGPSGAVLDQAVQRYQRSEKALVAALAFGQQS